MQRRPADQRYLGLLGPVIRAQAGDTIKVIFRNNCSFPASIHPHGVFYEKDSEGAPYNDGTSGEDKSDDAVPTGGGHTYTWEVPERAGPGPGDTSSMMWMYHSHTDEVADTYAGLMGPIEVTARGMARPDGSPKDVDREFFVLFSVMNENQSPFLVENRHRFAEKPYPTDLDDDDFTESNLMHSINGDVFGNGPMMKMHKGERARWYVMSMGTEVDLHTPHWHGNAVVVNGMRMDTVSLLPAGMIVADMAPDNPGIWLFHCHVNDHIRAGMLTRYEVLGSGDAWVRPRRVSGPAPRRRVRPAAPAGTSEGMFDHVTIRASDRGATERFYDTVLEPLGISKSHSDADGAMWDDLGMYAVDGTHPATHGLHVGFVAPSRDHVDRFWQTGTEAGYRDDGAPGPRPEYGDDYYGGFLLDPDGNSAEAVHHDTLRSGGSIDHLWIRVADVAASRAFYAQIAPHAGFALRLDTPERARFAGESGSFSVLAGARPTEHLHLAFPAPDNATVDRFHAAATGAGYRDHGGPGERLNYHEGYYGAFVLDPDGNNVEVVCHNEG